MNRQFVYFPPGRRQFYFSKSLLNRGQYPLFYLPLTLKAKFIWKLIGKVRLARSFFTISEAELPEDIRQKVFLIHSNDKEQLQINIGTSGPEQKTTIIKHNGQENTFYKIGNTKLSKRLIRNEHRVLCELNGKFHSPTVLSYIEKGEYCILETSYLCAEKLPETRLNEQVFKVLIELVEHKIDMNQNLISCFSHGDFCPWNMLIQNNILFLIDWEMADIRPLGYDLFTYIFQTTFLLNPQREVEEIIEENKSFITRYFQAFNQQNPNAYFNVFVEQKIQSERKKGAKTVLLEKFIALKEQKVQIQL